MKQELNRVLRSARELQEEVDAMGMGRPAPEPTFDERYRERARREAAVVEAARRYVAAFNTGMLVKERDYYETQALKEARKQCAVALQGLFAAVASLEELTGPLPQESTR